MCIITVCSCTGGADVLYNKFNVTSSTPPENPSLHPNSQYNCVIATTDGYWRLSRCTEEHLVVCQSGKRMNIVLCVNQVSSHSLRCIWLQLFRYTKLDKICNQPRINVTQTHTKSREMPLSRV